MLVFMIPMMLLYGCKNNSSASTTDELARAKRLIAQGNFSEAFMQLNQALAEAPRDPNVHLNLGWAPERYHGRQTTGNESHSRPVAHQQFLPEMGTLFITLGFLHHYAELHPRQTINPSATATHRTMPSIRLAITT